MLDRKFFAKIKQILLDYAEKRRDVIKLASDAQHLSKQAIFALQRDSEGEADKLLSEAENIISKLEKKYQKDESLFDEGSYRAGLEEFVEAYLFRQCLKNKKLSAIGDLNVEPNIYIGGIADVPGELARYAVKSATERKFDIVKQCLMQAEEIIGVMIKMNLTGYNRQKFDQAKQSLGKIQQIYYEISIRK
ncbi:MAG: hypothetical protein COU29_04410 [Candidatus Magasanikbacteria bacterium CG10_big_fil_rev_8_21_14_0_10_36_32]|uniref:Haloacid dehalogenase n=1 Tax=Candidatus Magasanikbacteria bacterium CG10_big_fil_rev_8_21_14_0_10_36_32 TaxID=1974646 RepID=A0A2M6W5E0_9BACT|nr:MAG: hypothetical protein COU29_04410 [Candidatus Magasanikbacteria bacterium CG10_big_fil_rev_8_21_14_0_10_36_32]